MPSRPSAPPSAESEAVATEAEVDDETLPERLRKAPPEGRTETREPLYDERDVERAVAAGARLRLRRRGRGDRWRHARSSTTPGTSSARPSSSCASPTASATRTIVFSGDLGRNDTPIVRDPTPLTHADYVVVESTYGNREHGPHEEAIEELVAAIGEVADDEGVLLMPAFAIGRTQEVIWVLDDLVRDGRIPRIPLYLDSPMASRATAGLPRPPRDLRRGDRRACCAPATRR